MDVLLPVQPFPWTQYPRLWRDVPRSDAVEISVDSTEPLTVDEVKEHLNLGGVIEHDQWIARAIPVARRQVEIDMNRTLVLKTLEMTFDQFPREPWLTLPAPPLVAVTSLSSFDYTGVETVDTTLSSYLVDSHSQPGRLIVKPTAVWPSGVRPQQGGKIRWTAGSSTVPARAIHAMLLLLGHWFENREAVTSGAFGNVPVEYPLGYEALISDRLISLG